MNIRTIVTGVRLRVPALALAALLGVAASGALAPSASAEAIGVGVTPNVPCYIPGSPLPYVTGEKATFSVNGQPAKEYTCQKDGTWTASMAPGTWGAHWATRANSAVFVP
jgi:hypothetical protein